MGLWAGIKHAINSTLGTKDFMPLDELIRNQKTIYASGEKYVDVYADTITVEAEKYSEKEVNVPILLKMMGAGSFRIRVVATGAYLSEARMKIFKNGELEYESSNASNSDTGRVTIVKDFSFKNGDVFEFKYINSNTQGFESRSIIFGALEMLGTVVDNFFEIQEA